MVFEKASATSNTKTRQTAGWSMAALAMAAFIVASGCKSELDKHYGAAKAHTDAGEFKEAAAEYEAVLKIDPNHTKTHYRLANIYLDELKDMAMAMEHFRRVVELDPKYAKAWEKLTRIYLTQGQVDDAIKAIKDSLQAEAYSDKPEKKDLIFVELQKLEENRQNPEALKALISGREGGPKKKEGNASQPSSGEGQDRPPAPEAGGESPASEPASIPASQGAM